MGSSLSRETAEDQPPHSQRTMPAERTISTASTAPATTPMTMSPLSTTSGATSTRTPRAPAPRLSPEEIAALVKELGSANACNLLIGCGVRLVTVEKRIVEAVEAQRAAAAAKVYDFDHYSKSAWHGLYGRAARGPSSRAFMAAGGVEMEIQDALQYMLKKSRGGSFGTKCSAIKTTRKIYKSIALADDTLSSEVRKSAAYWRTPYMVRILETFSADERARLAEDLAFDGKLVELANLARGYCVFEEVDDVIDMLDAARPPNRP